ncbi:GAF domain-containing protein [Haloarcula amylovorans]|uniref:GAF domain-containing protein n=1 Tax=Haloarcula amylovorans TaxID=2562280 RepID=UPI0014305CFC|nr:GAF domain-containing protein [Halomicroarcula amylolytica]
MTDSIQVLHVDDDPDLSELVAEFLHRENDRFEVTTAARANEGLSYLKSDNYAFDCIVSDYEMTDKNGISFLEDVREIYPDIPFILYTGKGSEEVASDAISAGATDYLQKDAGTDQYTILANRIQNVVEQYRSQRRAEEHQRITKVIRNLNRALVYADSVAEIEQEVCAILSDADPYVTACIADVNTDTMQIEPHTWAGNAADYFTNLDMSVDEDSPGRHAPGGRAYHERDIATSQNIADDPQYEQWRDAATELGFQSLAVIPLEYDDELYALLAVFADRRYAFDAAEQDLLAELGNDIAHAMHAQEVQSTLRTRNRAIEEAPVGVTVTDPDKTDNPLIYVNDEFTGMSAYPEEEILDENCRILQGPETDNEPVATLREGIDNEERVTVELRNYRKNGEQFWNRVSIAPVYDDAGQLINYIGFQEEITERKQQEHRAAGLNEMLAEFMEADTEQRICNIVVAAAQSQLDIPIAEVLLVDETSGQLRPAAQSKLAQQYLSEKQLLEEENGTAWEVFVSGEPTTIENPPTNLVDRAAAVETLYIHPLGKHGVFIAGLDSVDFDFVQTVSENIRSAIERLGRKKRLKEREELLEEQNEWLNRLNRINDVVRNIDQILVQASSRSEIEQAVCTELINVDAYSFTWIGKYDSTSKQIAPREWAGNEQNYLESVSFYTGDTSVEQSPTVQAIQSREPQVLNTVLSDPPYEPWREAALKRGYRSSIALPLIYRDSLYGVLNIYTDQPAVFDELEQQVLSELSETIAYAINAVESKKALVSDEIIDLELRVDASDHPLMAFIQEDPTREFELKGVVPAENNVFKMYYLVRGTTSEAVFEFAENSVVVRDTELITERDGECLFECIVTEKSLIFWLLNRGAVPRSISVSKDSGRVRLELSGDASVRDFVELFEAEYSNSELIASRKRERPISTREEFDATFEEKITPRQREILQTAYLSGYFETPRERNGQEIAESVGISQPTFSDNLRAGLRNLLGLLYEEDDADLDS